MLLGPLILIFNLHSTAPFLSAFIIKFSNGIIALTLIFAFLSALLTLSSSSLVVPLMLSFPSTVRRYNRRGLESGVLTKASSASSNT